MAWFRYANWAESVNALHRRDIIQMPTLVRRIAVGRRSRVTNLIQYSYGQFLNVCSKQDTYKQNKAQTTVAKV